MRQGDRIRRNLGVPQRRSLCARWSAATALSVIVCTRNRAGALANCLGRLATLVPPQGVATEILVVDNGSSDDTAAVIDRAAATAELPIRHLSEPRQGASRARNRALRTARGDLLAVTDDDCIPAEDWLRALVAAFDKDPDLGLLGGRVELHDPTDRRVTIKTKREQAVLSTATALGGFIHGCNLAFRRKVLERIGGYDLRFGPGALIPAAEDADLVYRAFLAGFKIVYEPTVVVAHAHGRKTESAEVALRRLYRIGLGALQSKYILRADRAMWAWAKRELGAHLHAALGSWRSPRLAAQDIARASHHLQGAARYALAEVLELATHRSSAP
jgi:GT2 family glycosyltransferase